MTSTLPWRAEYLNTRGGSADEGAYMKRDRGVRRIRASVYGLQSAQSRCNAAVLVNAAPGAWHLRVALLFQCSQAIQWSVV